MAAESRGNAHERGNRHHSWGERQLSHTHPGRAGVARPPRRVLGRTYKKSMLTPITLSLVAEHQPAEISTVAEAVTAATGWQITERGLYRTIKRLQDSRVPTAHSRRCAADRGEAQAAGPDSAEGELPQQIKGDLVEVPSQ